MKKISLAGRKRIGELGDNQAVLAKRDQLKALQAQVEAFAPVTEPEPVIEPKPEDKPEAQAATKPVEQQPELFSTTDLPLASEMVTQLFDQYKRMDAEGTKNCRAYSHRQIEQVLVSKLTDTIQQMAVQGLHQGLNDAQNHRHCQAFVDEVCQGLAAQGIQLPRLKLKPRG